jgi:hypothetical protein
MQLVSLRTALLACALIAASTMTFVWRWPAVWRAGAATVRDTNGPRDGLRRPAADDLTPAPSSFGWLVLIGVMALLFGGWILVVVLT